MTQQIIIGVTSLLFGGLFTYFIKSVSDKRSADSMIKEITKESIHTHVQIHHKKTVEDIVDEKISDMRKDSAALKKSLHNLELYFMKLIIVLDKDAATELLKDFQQVSSAS